MGILLTALGIGALIGWLTLVAKRVYAGENGLLKQEQVEAFRWETSAEGKFARNLMRWNSNSLTNLEYKKDVKR
ncbi:hypothetical protein QUA42_25810 [Microcoleus sp. Pol11C2]